MSKTRVGFGYDVHQLSEGERLIIGGIEIDHTKGTVAHSDGDVLIHAICDALLGAVAMKDIGFHFPDTDLTYKNINSLTLLTKTKELITGKGYNIGNIDSTLALQKPKIKQYIESMRNKLAQNLNIEIDDISIKATTTEKLGFVGREEGISAYAIVLLEKQ